VYDSSVVGPGDLVVIASWTASYLLLLLLLLLLLGYYYYHYYKKRIKGKKLF